MSKGIFFKAFNLVAITAIATSFTISGITLAEPTMLHANAIKVWNVDSARQEAFNGAQGVIDTWGYSGKDPNYKLHKAAISKNSRYVLDSLITNFNTGEYGVSKKCDVQSYYYDGSNGGLLIIQVNTSAAFSDGKSCDSNLPVRGLRYTFPEGKLFQASFTVSEDESFVYASNGTLISHWIKDKCFDANGSSCGTRKAHYEGHWKQPE